MAGQAVAHFRTYLKDDDEIRNVLQYHNAGLVDLIHDQMQAHYHENAASYDVKVSKENLPSGIEVLEML